MRVLHASHFHSTEVTGGVQKVVDALVADQLQRGWHPAVVSGAMALDEGRGTHQTTDGSGAPVTRLSRSADERFSGDLGSSRLGEAVEAVARQHRPDVCHVHHWHALTTDLVRRLSRHAPVVVTLHDAYPTCPRFFRTRLPPVLCAADLAAVDCAHCLHPDLGIPVADLTPLLEQRHRQFAAELAAATRVLAVSENLRQRLLAVPHLGQPAIAVLPLGAIADPGPVPPPPLVPGRLRLSHWSGIDPRKGLDLLAEAMAGSIHAAGFELDLFGRELQPGYVDQLKQRAGQATIRWHGPLADLQALRHIAATTDLAVAPSLLPETHGLAVDEALRMGMAVIVSDLGAPKHRVGTRGRVVAVTSPQPLREVLEELLLDLVQLRTLRRGTHTATGFGTHAEGVAAAYLDAVGP